MPPTSSLRGVPSMTHNTMTCLRRAFWRLWLHTIDALVTRLDQAFEPPPTTWAEPNPAPDVQTWTEEMDQ